MFLEHNFGNLEMFCLKVYIKVLGVSFLSLLLCKAFIKEELICKWVLVLGIRGYSVRAG